MRIETNHARGISDKVRECIDVVKEQRPIAIVDDVLNAADVDLCCTNDSFYRSDHLGRWLKRLDSQTRTRRIDRASCSREFNSVSGLADVSGAQIEGVAGGEDSDRVEILAAECFNARDVAVAWRNKLLDQGCLIDPQIKPVVRSGADQ